MAPVRRPGTLSEATSLKGLLQHVAAIFAEVSGSGGYHSITSPLATPHSNRRSSRPPVLKYPVDVINTLRLNSNESFIIQLIDFLERKLNDVAVDQVLPFLNEIVNKLPKILKLWRRTKWFSCLPTLFLKHAEDGPEIAADNDWPQARLRITVTFIDDNFRVFIAGVVAHFPKDVQGVGIHKANMSSFFYVLRWPVKQNHDYSHSSVILRTYDDLCRRQIKNDFNLASRIQVLLVFEPHVQGIFAKLCSDWVKLFDRYETETHRGPFKKAR
jgi:hypothetical protein